MMMLVCVTKDVSTPMKSAPFAEKSMQHVVNWLSVMMPLAEVDEWRMTNVWMVIEDVSKTRVDLADVNQELNGVKKVFVVWKMNDEMLMNVCLAETVELMRTSAEWRLVKFVWETIV